MDKEYKSMYYTWDNARNVWRVVRLTFDGIRSITPYGWTAKDGAKHYIAAFGFKPVERRFPA
jgi:hypothetical protein